MHLWLKSAVLHLDILFSEIQTNDLDSHSTQTEPVSVEYSNSLPHGAPFTQQLPPPYSMPVQQNFPDTASEVSKINYSFIHLQ